MAASTYEEEMEEHGDATAQEAKHRGTTLVGGRCNRVFKISTEQKEYRKYKNKQQRTKNKEQRTKNKEQRTKNKEQRTKNKEQRTYNKQQTTNNKQKNKKQNKGYSELHGVEGGPEGQ